MASYPLDSSAVVFNHPEYGNRLLFKDGLTNPRDKLGKNGVTIHNGLSRFFYKTIELTIPTVAQDGSTQQQTFYVNRNSLIKYLRLDPSQSYTAPQLIEQLRQQTQLTPQDKQTAGETGLRHAGQYNQKPLSLSVIGTWLANAVSWLYQKTIGSINGIKLRFLAIGTERALLETGENLARHRYAEALATVPAYQTHIATHNGHAVDPKSLKDVPTTDKSNYIKPQAYDSALHIGGVYPHPYKVDTSTGTTGKPTAWVRGQKELETVKKSLQLASKIQFGDRRLSYIDAFALGPWATGLTTYELMRGTGGILATGPDKDKIYDELLRIQKEETHQIELAVARLSLPQEMQPQVEQLLANCLHRIVREKATDIKAIYHQLLLESGLQSNTDFKQYQKAIFDSLKQLNQQKAQIIVAGYPPFLNDLIKYVKEKGHDFRDFNVIGVVGGQAISEAMRDLLIRDGYNQIYSSYGASDLDINLGVETEFEISVRRAIEQHPELGKELYGANKGLPMVFHYDPLNYHVECSDENDLIYTCTRDDRSSPRIRYNLGDKGRVYASSDVQALLAKYGIFSQPKTNLPLMFVWGRESTVVYNGANLAFTELERAVTDNDPDNHILKKAFYSYLDDDGAERTEIWLELNDDVELSAEEKTEFAATMLQQLASINQDFRWQLEQLDENSLLMNVRFFNRGTSPISEAGGHRKQVLVFNQSNLPDDFELSDNKDCSKIEIYKHAEQVQSKMQAAI